MLVYIYSILHPRPQNFGFTFSWRWKPVIRDKQSAKDLFMFICFEEIYSCSPSILQSGKMCRLRAIPRNCQEIPGFFSLFVLAVQILGDFQALCPISGVFGPKLFLPQKVKRLGYSSLLPAVLQEVTIWELANGDIRWDPKQRSPPKKNKG